jgi:ferredoxin--NADP+ reductase
VTGRLTELIDAGGSARPDVVVAIGPMAMMRAVAEATRPSGIKTWVSMDPIMVDGTGMCGGCRVMVGGRPQFACVDGPCFDGHAVDFASAMRRNKAYTREERAAVERIACASSEVSTCR